MGVAAEELGHSVTSVDWTAYPGVDLVMDINDFNTDTIDFVPGHVHASFDCTTYTIAAISTHRNGTEPKSEYAKQCDKVNLHVIGLIKGWLAVNPNLTFSFENPRGMLRHMPFMKEFKRHTVWYCRYSDDRAKPTDIWTNIEGWQPRPECHNYKYDKDGNVINRHCHHQSARRGAKTGTQGRKDAHLRSLIPHELCIEILSSIGKPKISTNLLDI